MATTNQIFVSAMTGSGSSTTSTTTAGSAGSVDDKVLGYLSGLQGDALIEAARVLQDVIERAARVEQTRRSAKLELSRTYPRCACGEPAVSYGYPTVEWAACKPAIQDTKSGEARAVIAIDTDSWENSGGSADFNHLLPHGDKTVFVSCDKGCGSVGVVSKDELPMIEYAYGTAYKELKVETLPHPGEIVALRLAEGK